MRRHFLQLGFLVAVLSWVPVGPALAQQSSSELRGSVVDEQGGVLPGVAIVIRNQGTGVVRETVSGADGSYFASALNPGVYGVTATLSGFRRSQVSNIPLQVGRTSTLKLTLRVGGLEETITVTSESPLVDLTSKEIGGHIDDQALVDLPSVNRNFTGFLSLLPGVIATVNTNSFGADSVSVNGQSTRNVNFAYDGANNNDTFNAGTGGAQARIPIESVQEFQFLTSQFDAEFGASSGGVVNAISKTGTNRLRGSVFGFFQDSSLTAPDIFAKQANLEKPDNKERQWGGTIGGPILKDKAHFFLSLERVTQDAGISVNIPSRPDLNRTDTEKTRVWNTLVRVDQQIKSSNNMAVRWLRESSPQFNQLDTDWTADRAEQEFDIDQTLVGTLNSVLGDTMVNTVRVSFTREDVKFGNPGFIDNGGDQAALPPTFNFLSFSSGQSPRATGRDDQVYAFDETLAWFLPGKRGDHDLKFGLQYLYNNLTLPNSGNLNGTFTFDTDRPFNPNDPTTYPERLQITVPGQTTPRIIGQNIGLFIQDKWKMGNKLTLSLGVRYDLEIIPVPERNNFLFSDSGSSPVDKNNFSPRLGFSYAPSERSVVRGGFGLFFQKTPFTFLDEFYRLGVTSDAFTASFPANRADPGPSSGAFPTDPLLVGGPTVNRALLGSLFPSGTTQTNQGTVWLDNPDRRSSYSRQYSIGYERQLAGDMSASVDFIHSENRGQVLRQNLNPGLRVSTSRTARLVRTDPRFVTDVWNIVNDGFIDYDSVQLSLLKRFTRGWAFRTSYAWSYTRGNTPQGNNEIIETQVLDNVNLSEFEGRTTSDRPHNLVISGTWEVPMTKGLRISSVMRAYSGEAFTLFDSSVDLNRNGRSVDDVLPAGTYSGEGPNGFTVDNKGGQRGARGPAFFELDLRTGYRLRLPNGQAVEFFGELFNVTNRTNFDVGGNTGDRRRTSDFLIGRSLVGGGPTRKGQFGVRFAF